MKHLFADTGYWIALLDPRDDLHERAVEKAWQFRERHFVTTDLVLVELLNDFAARGSHLRQAASRFVEGLFGKSQITVIPTSSERIALAREFYSQRIDKAWSLTDCDSILTCNQLEISEALTHDRHFIQAGLICLTT